MKHQYLIVLLAKYSIFKTKVICNGSCCLSFLVLDSFQHLQAVLDLSGITVIV